MCDGWMEDLTCMSDGVSGMQNLNPVADLGFHEGGFEGRARLRVRKNFL